MKKFYEKVCKLEELIALILVAGIAVLVFVSALMRTQMAFVSRRPCRRQPQAADQAASDGNRNEPRRMQQKAGETGSSTVTSEHSLVWLASATAALGDERLFMWAC